jgi:hypothetical protein
MSTTSRLPSSAPDPLSPLLSVAAPHSSSVDVPPPSTLTLTVPATTFLLSWCHTHVCHREKDASMDRIDSPCLGASSHSLLYTRTCHRRSGPDTRWLDPGFTVPDPLRGRNHPLIEPGRRSLLPRTTCRCTLHQTAPGAISFLSSPLSKWHRVPFHSSLGHTAWCDPLPWCT